MAKLGDNYSNYRSYDNFPASYGECVCGGYLELETDDEVGNDYLKCEDCGITWEDYE